MTPRMIYRKTMVFNWYKLGFGLLTLFFCAIIFGATWFIAHSMELELKSIIGISCAAFLLAVTIYYFMMVRSGYSIIVGHLAVIEHTLRTDSVPDNPVGFSRDVVQQRFGSNRKYYFFARSLRVATTEINRVIARGFSLDSDTPNNSKKSAIVRLFSYPALTYVDECCMAYALRKSDYEVNAACVDGLTILTQNWQKFMGGAFRTSLIIYAFVLAATILFFIPGYAICQMFMYSWLPWLGMSLIIALVFKMAFLDSYVLTKMVCNFLDITGNATIEKKNYIKLDHWSKAYAKFRKAAEKAAEKAEVAADKAEREAAQQDKQKALSPASEEIDHNEKSKDNSENSNSSGSVENSAAENSSEVSAAEKDDAPKEDTKNAPEEENHIENHTNIENNTNDEPNRDGDKAAP